MTRIIKLLSFLQKIKVMEYRLKKDISLTFLATYLSLLPYCQHEAFLNIYFIKTKMYIFQ